MASREQLLLSYDAFYHVTRAVNWSYYIQYEGLWPRRFQRESSWRSGDDQGWIWLCTEEHIAENLRLIADSFPRDLVVLEVSAKAVARRRTDIGLEVPEGEAPIVSTDEAFEENLRRMGSFVCLDIIPPGALSCLSEVLYVL